MNIDSAIPSDDPLSLDEKKALGLNSRKKYSKELIQLIDCSKLNGRCPREQISNYFHAAMHLISGEASLRKMRAAGISHVSIMACNDGRDCERVAALNRVFRIEEVPALPLKECDAPFCRCLYGAELVDL